MEDGERRRGSMKDGEDVLPAPAEACGPQVHAVDVGTERVEPARGVPEGYRKSERRVADGCEIEEVLPERPPIAHPPEHPRGLPSRPSSDEVGIASARARERPLDAQAWPDEDSGFHANRRSVGTGGSHASPPL